MSDAYINAQLERGWLDATGESLSLYFPVKDEWYLLGYRAAQAAIWQPYRDNLLEWQLHP